MSKSVFVTGVEKNAGKSLVSIGLVEHFKAMGLRTILFRPVIEDVEKNKANIEKIKAKLGTDWKYEDTYALTVSQIQSYIANDQIDEALEKIIEVYMNNFDKYDFIVCEATGFHGPLCTHEINLNTTIAKNLSAPILFVANGQTRDAEQTNLCAQIALQSFKRKKLSVIGAIVNRASQDQKLNLNCDFTGLITENAAVDSVDNIDIDHFKNSIDVETLCKQIRQAPTPGDTVKMFENRLVKMNREVRVHIVLPEGNDERVLKAAESLLKRDLMDLTILGDVETTKKVAAEHNIDISKATLLDPKTSDKLEAYAHAFYELRKHKGMTEEKALETCKDVSYYGTMMIKMGDADGMVSGAAHSTADTVRPGLQILKTIPGTPIVSGSFIMCLEGRVSIYADCGVNPNPNTDELAALAVSTAETGALFGIPSDIAFHSYATGNSAKGPMVDFVVEAMNKCKALRPEYNIDGPIQYDAAVDASVGAKKLPGSKLAGHARVHIFPDLNVGNIVYKAVQRETGCAAFGPILQGINGAVNDLSRGCTVVDVIDTILITGVQSHRFKK